MASLSTSSLASSPLDSSSAFSPVPSTPPPPIFASPPTSPSISPSVPPAPSSLHLPSYCSSCCSTPCCSLCCPLASVSMHFIVPRHIQLPRSIFPHLLPLLPFLSLFPHSLQHISLPLLGPPPSTPPLSPPLGSEHTKSSTCTH
ncbi:unnamed protein product [Closterium sp. Naga37s-1]|nr:unnamed protein product [Closterium sp. Naga37s-1]